MGRIRQATATVARAGRGTWWRAPYLVVLGYCAVVIAGNAAVTGGILIGRWTGNDTRIDDPAFPDVRNLRRVDEKLLAGAQPTRAHFDRFAELGVTLVVDLRTGVPGDPNDDDPEQLRALGMRYLRLPVHDGHAPDAETVERFVAAVHANDGQVYMHCGGGVGRSTSLQAAYLAATGTEPSVLEQLAIGPPTFEQLVYAARASEANPSPNNAVVSAISRFIFDGPRQAVNWVGARI